MNPCRGVGCSGPARDEGDAGATGHLAVGIGHVGDPALLPANDGLDRGSIVEGVEHGEKAFTGDGEQPVAALQDELVDENAATATHGHERRLSEILEQKK